MTVCGAPERAGKGEMLNGRSKASSPGSPRSLPQAGSRELYGRGRPASGFEKAHAAGDKNATIDVPCNGCRACCYYNALNVNPNEEPPERLKHLQLRWNEQYQCWEIPKSEDGACIYLGPNGCTVYEHRPTACRYYDCRLAAIFGWQQQFEGEQKAPIWEFTDSGTDLGMLKIRHMFGQVWLKEHTDGPLLHDLIRDVETHMTELAQQGELTRLVDRVRRNVRIDPTK